MFKKITLFCFVLAWFAVGLGAYAHLSKSGLGCPDWPTCFGRFYISPDDDFNSITGAANKDQAFSRWQLLAEIAYRYVITALGFSLLVLALSAWWEKKYRLVAVAESSALLVLFGLLAAGSYWVTASSAEPVGVTALVLLELLVCLRLFSLSLPNTTDGLPKVVANRLLVNVNRFVLLTLFLHIGYVTWGVADHAYLYALDKTLVWGEIRLFPTQGIMAIDDGALWFWVYIASVFVNFTLLTLLTVIAAVRKEKRAISVSSWAAWVLFIALTALEVTAYLAEVPMWAVVVHKVTSVLALLPLMIISRYGGLALPEAEAPTIAVALAQPVQAVPSLVFPETKPESLYARLTSKLQKTRTGLSGLLGNLALGQKQFDRDLLEEIETNLLMADIGFNVTQQIIGQLTKSLERRELNGPEPLAAVLRQCLLQVLEPCSQVLAIPKQDKPFVILVVGINGAGKTTTIGKLAKKLQAQGHSVMLAAGDTFRAAAVEQLQTWGERNNIAVIAQHSGADSASVIYDALQSAQANKIDVLIADTAGRLHTKSNLMDELKKVKRIMAKLDDRAPHEVLLVLDAGTGQNALSQAKLFNEAVGITGLALTKLDGTAKGGVIFALSQQFGIPVRFIGIGEGIDDLQDFNAKTFVDALLAWD